jgi:putative ATP-dependent endonuclease of OLD family
VKLHYFSIKNYRSITSAEINDLGNSVILIGPNNEGKSNILHGLNACLTILTSNRPTIQKDSVKLRLDRTSYDWQRDYPIARQEKYASGESIFQLHFQLSSDERKTFKKITGSSLSDILPIELRFNQSLFATFKVLKRGPGGSVLTKKSEKIRKFLSQVLDFVYIPAIRTADTSIEVVSQLIEREFKALEENSQYVKLQQQLEALQQPILDSISKRLKDTLEKFIGKTVKSIDIDVSTRSRARYFSRTCQITVDDGTPTLLERKGDGVQSLVAIGLMSSAIESSKHEKDIILLIEEPESHLHPKAIHQLRETIDDIKINSQVFITTHCPLLVNHENIPSNVIVSKNKASYAKSVSSIRDILGVRGSDNLVHTALIVVVEGPEDEIALRSLLSHFSTSLQDAFNKGTLAMYPIGGASKLSHTLQMLKHNICNYINVLDDDLEARKGFAVASENMLASQSNTLFIKCPGLPEAEFEDLLDESVYAEHFKTKYGVDITTTTFKHKSKWSERIRKGLEKSGKSSPSGEAWPERDEYETKRTIGDIVAASPQSAIHPSKIGLLTNITAAIESKLNSITI